MRAMPAGVMTFWLETAFITSAGLSPMESSLVGSMSTAIMRERPPKGAGVERPGMVNSFMRMKLVAWS